MPAPPKPTAAERLAAFDALASQVDGYLAESRKHLAAMRAILAGETAPQPAMAYCPVQQPETRNFCELDAGHPLPHGYVAADGTEVTWGEACPDCGQPMAAHATLDMARASAGPQAETAR